MDVDVICCAWWEVRRDRESSVQNVGARAAVGWDRCHEGIVHHGNVHDLGEVRGTCEAVSASVCQSSRVYDGMVNKWWSGSADTGWGLGISVQACSCDSSS